MRHLLLASVLLASIFAPLAASAQPTDEEGDEEGDAPAGEASDPGSAEPEAGPAGADVDPDAQANTEVIAAAGTKPDEEGNSPHEDPAKRYNFIGLRYRHIVVPEAFIDLFASGGATVSVPTAGLEFQTRKDGLEIDIALSYADYSKGPFLAKGKNDPPDAWEQIESSIGVVYATLDMLWSVPMDDAGRYQFMIGGGIGIGGVFGDLRRNQVYPNAGVDPARDDPEPGDFVVCQRQGDPAAPPAPGGVHYCGTDNEHYPGQQEVEPSWINGGSFPVVWPWLSLPQVSFRWKPVKRFVARADLGFNVFSGIYFGASAAYGL